MAPPRPPPKLKRLTIELHPELHRGFMTWCRANGVVARSLVEQLILTALAQSGDFSPEQIEAFHAHALGSRRDA